jgi:hypothetical protein
MFIATLAVMALLQMSACHRDDSKTNLADRAPLTSTVAVVCSHGEQRVMFAVFTYPGDRMVVADKDNPLGFTSVEDLLQYAQTAATPRLYVQPCEGTTT